MKLKTHRNTKPTRLTDFFTRAKDTAGPSSSPEQPRLKSSQATSATTSQAQQATTTTATTMKRAKMIPQDREVISISSESHISISSDSIASIPKTTTTKNAPKTRLQTSATMATLDHPDTFCPKKQRTGAAAKPRSQKRDLASPIRVKAPPQSPAEVRAQPRSPQKERTRRAKKRSRQINSDSEVDVLDTVIYVPKAVRAKVISAAAAAAAAAAPVPGPLTPKENLTNQVRTSAHKKQRLSLPNNNNKGDLIPSSQSDEQELVPPRTVGKNVEETIEGIERWRQEAAITPAPVDEAAFDDELPLPPPPSTLNTDDEGDSHRDMDHSALPVVANDDDSLILSRQSPVVRTPEPLAQLATLRSLPGTPPSLDPDAKTARIIAEIKAKAYLATAPSPEIKPIAELKELDDSSDDSDFDVLAWRLSGDSKTTRTLRAGTHLFSSPLSSVPRSSPKRPLSPSPLPYSLRSRRGAAKPAAPSFVSTTTERTSTIPLSSRSSRSNSGKDKPRPSRLQPKPTRPAVTVAVKERNDDPLGMLLREKQRAEKAGKGMDDLRFAENAVAAAAAAAGGAGAMAPGDDLTDEAAALRAVREGLALGLSSPIFGSPNGSAAGGSDGLPEVEDRERLLGSERGKAILHLLANDKARRKSGQGRAKVSGVPLWKVDWDMEAPAAIVDAKLPAIGGAPVHPIVTAIRAAVERGDNSRASLLLKSGVLAMPLSESAGIVCFLCELALCTSLLPYGESAFHVVLHVLNNKHNPPAVFVPLSLVLSTLYRLGAEPSVMENVGWAALPEVRDENVTVETRTIIVYRLISILTAAARAGRLSPSEVPDFLMALLLLAIEPSTGVDTKRDVMVAIDGVCQGLRLDDDDDDDDSSKTDRQISDRLLKFASQLTPTNKALFVSFLAGGARTLRIARWLAYGLLTQDHDVPPESHVPPLSGIIELLSESQGPDGPFGIHNATDYEDVGSYTQILSVALSEIDDYVAEERKISQSDSWTSQDAGGSPKKGDKEKPLQICQRLLDGIYSKIVDTRAAHLDRSRTKAALQRLALRIYYQRRSILNSGDGKPRNLLGWIKK